MKIKRLYYIETVRDAHRLIEAYNKQSAITIAKRKYGSKVRSISRATKDHIIWLIFMGVSVPKFRPAQI